MFEGDRMIERITPFVHKNIKDYVTGEDIAIDMTAGNGTDTLFLASLCKHVYAFDIQKSAINNTNRLLKSKGISNVTTILDSHVNVNKHINEKVRCAVFNLGYLPKSDKLITTTGKTTLEAINNILPLMMKNSLISITVYIGHKEGQEESILLKEFVSTLPSNIYNVLQYSNLIKKNAPYNILIEKIGE